MTVFYDSNKAQHGYKSRGRPNKRWMRSVNDDMVTKIAGNIEVLHGPRMASKGRANDDDE